MKPREGGGHSEVKSDGGVGFLRVCVDPARLYPLTFMIKVPLGGLLRGLRGCGQLRLRQVGAEGEHEGWLGRRSPQNLLGGSEPQLLGILHLFWPPLTPAWGVARVPRHIHRNIKEWSPEDVGKRCFGTILRDL